MSKWKSLKVARTQNSKRIKRKEEAIRIVEEYIPVSQLRRSVLLTVSKGIIQTQNNQKRQRQGSLISINIFCTLIT